MVMDHALFAPCISLALAPPWAGRGKQDPRSLWLLKVRERRHANVVAVALANKNARITWSLLASRCMRHTRTQSRPCLYVRRSTEPMPSWLRIMSCHRFASAAEESEGQGESRAGCPRQREMVSRAAAPPLFYNLAEVNAAIGNPLTHLNEERPFAGQAQRLGFARRDDRPARKALPAETYEFSE
jgi:hypothetical protein